MSEEEVIERLHNFKSISILYGNTFAMHIEQLKQLQEDLDTVLQLLEQKDNKMNKVIDKLKEELNYCNISKNQYDKCALQCKFYEKLLKILEE